MSTDEHWDVFVSYGHGDAEWVHALAGNLHRRGLEVFLDVWEIAAGDRLTVRLEQAISATINGVLVVSPHSLGRPWVREEYEALLRQAVEQPGRRLVPVLYADAELPVFLANRLWVDFRNSATGPAYDAKVEELVRALQGLAPADRPARDSPLVWPVGQRGETVRAAGALQAVLSVSPLEVSLSDDQGVIASQAHGGLGSSTREAVRDFEWRRDHPRGGPPDELDGAIARVGRLLSTDFLSGRVGAGLAGLVARAATLNEVLELALEVQGREELPWETLQLPETSGEVAEVGGTALVLHHNVAVYRHAAGLGPRPAHQIRGPLRLLVAIASPESSDAELFDYERELARIIAAVDPVRKDSHAYVRVLNEGSLDAINTALEQDPEGFHVLHLSCHDAPGMLLLETTDGGPDGVTPERLLEEGLGAGAKLAMVVLSGRASGLGTQQPGAGRAGGHKDAGDLDQVEGRTALEGFAERLVRAGVPQVLAMQARVSDSYSTDLVAELYGYLAGAATPDPLLALTHARSIVERARQRLPLDDARRGRAEWATPALVLRRPRLGLFDPKAPFGELAEFDTPVLDEGVVVRKVGDFIGRRAELRACRRALSAARAGLLIHGIGGVGKSTLASEVLRSLAGETPITSKAGALYVDSVLDEVGARLHRWARNNSDERLTTVASHLRAADVEWKERWRLLREEVLDVVAMTVLLDNFEDNLHQSGATWELRDPELADLLARWARQPGKSRLVITSRHPFSLPEQSERRLAAVHLGPLSAAETRKLFWRLPGLDALPFSDQNRAYRNVGGHPRTLEYLDALLRGGEARFDDIAERMERRLEARGIGDPTTWLAEPGRDLDANLAEAVTLAVDDVVLAELLDHLDATPLARDLVIGASVYRVPVDDTALVFQVGETAEPPSDPERLERIREVQQGIGAAHQRSEDGVISLEDAGPSEDDLVRYRLDIEEVMRPPFGRPWRSEEGVVSLEDTGLSESDIAVYRTHNGEVGRPPIERSGELTAAVGAAEAAGLLAPVHGDGTNLHIVHRWTARAIAELHPDAVASAHRRAATYWHWRGDAMTRGKEEYVEQLLEARYHHRAASDTDKAVAVTLPIVVQLQTWGQYGRAAELCRETLNWLPELSVDAADLCHQLGNLALARQDYDLAEERYRQSLDVYESLSNQPAMADSYHQLGILAQARGDYDGAEACHRKSLQLEERLGNELGVARSYHELGSWPRPGGTLTTPRLGPSSHSRSSRASATRTSWHGRTTHLAAWPRPGGTSMTPRPGPSSHFRSSRASATRRAWRSPTSRSASWPDTAAATTKPRPCSAKPLTSARISAIRP
jgi:hypothetical protein